MKYAQIDRFEVCNGEGIGVSLFVQGCHFHCPGCFNAETWDFERGTEWTKETKIEFLKLVQQPYIKRVSILGGEPLAPENVKEIYNLLWEIHEENKNIWIYTGYKWEDLLKDETDCVEELDRYRRATMLLTHVLVDGRFEEDKKDLSLRFKGSSNQRVIDVQKSLEKGEIVLWTAS